MIQLMVSAKVWYACTLTEEDENAVRDYAEKSGTDLTDAVKELYAKNEIEIYKDSEESDFMTWEIEDVEEE